MNENYTIHEIEEMLESLKKAVTNKTPFFIVCMGDAE